MMSKPKLTAQQSIVVVLTLERSNLLDSMRDLLLFYDRVAGNVYTGAGWTPAEIARLAEIRKLVSKG